MHLCLAWLLSLFLHFLTSLIQLWNLGRLKAFLQIRGRDTGSVPSRLRKLLLGFRAGDLWDPVLCWRENSTSRVLPSPALPVLPAISRSSQGAGTALPAWPHRRSGPGSCSCAPGPAWAWASPTLGGRQHPTSQSPHCFTWLEAHGRFCHFTDTWFMAPPRLGGSWVHFEGTAILMCWWIWATCKKKWRMTQILASELFPVCDKDLEMCAGKR